ncbi:phage holin family protein [Anaerosporobacter sp.]
MKVEKANVLGGVVVAFLTAVFGQYWFLFVGFLVLSVGDYVTGWIKAKYWKHNESSAIGAKGIVKKVFYWLVIVIAFFISYCFIQMGDLLGINLSFVQLFGWFTLASYIINEIRSIIENLIEMGCNVPKFLSTGLDITQKLLDAKTNTNESDGETNG